MSFFELLGERALVWIVLFPLFGALINGVAGRYAGKSTVRLVAVGSIVGSFLLALVAFGSLVAQRFGDAGDEARVTLDVYEWFRVTLGGSLDVPIRVRFVMDSLSGLMTLVVTGIGLLIHIYASSYMEEDKAYWRFFTYLNLFMASMLILVLASNLPLMFVGWEGVGLCSYLLIGFWYDNPTYAAAGKKAFITNRIGDFGVLLGMFLLVVATRSFEFREINHNAALLGSELMIGGTATHITIATAACLCLFLGCAGKSAQLPLYVWLPDAMAGPTPVSALIHAATMVTAGVYLCCRLSAVFVMSPAAMAVIAIVGALTAFLAASIGLVQNQMKKILAYSTVSQLGFMFAAVGVGAFGAGIFHVFTHAFFKACLFLGAGSVMHAVHAHGDADIRELGGMKKWMPRTRITFLWSCLAIAGFPFTSGFFSKDDILLGAASTHLFHELPGGAFIGWFVFGLLTITAFMTAFYMFRLYFRTFEGEYRGGPKHEAHGDDHAHADDHASDDHASDDHAHVPHESPDAMTVPLLILGGAALVVGFLGLPHWIPGLEAFSVWGNWLEPALARAHGEEHHIELWLGATVMVVGTAAGLGGIGLAYSWYYASDGSVPARLAASWPRLHAFLMDKWRVDELYEVTVLAASRGLARFSSNFDKSFVDGILAKGTAFVVQGAGWASTRIQNGQLFTYAGAMVAGFAVLAWWFLVPHAGLRTATRGNEVRFVAAQGLGYAYRWDVDDDGDWDTRWSATESQYEHAYEASEFVGGAALLEGPIPNMNGERITEYRLTTDRFVKLDPGTLGDGWAREPDTTPVAQQTEAQRNAPRPDGTPPALRWDIPEEPTAEIPATGALLLRPNGAHVRFRGRDVTEPVHLLPGEIAQIGQTVIRAAVVVRGTVEVRNAFGNTTTETAEIVLQVESTGAQASLEGGAL